MEYKQQTILVRQTFVCLLFFIVITLFTITDTSAASEPEIISTQDEVITYVNHTAKLSCIIQDRNREHVTWSRVSFINETQKLTNLLFVDLLKYTPFTRYHLTHLVEKEKREYWNLEIRHVHLADQGFYSCVLTATKPISKIFYVKVLENARNPALTLRSTSEMQRRAKEQIVSSLSLNSISMPRIFLMIVLLLIL